MNIIQECMDDEEAVNECGRVIRNIFEIDITYIDKQTLICQECKSRMHAIKSFECCPKCSTYNDDDLFDTVQKSCESFDFDIQTKKAIQYFSAHTAELCKIKIQLPSRTANANIEQIYGIALCAISFEENDWSSTPHNFFMTKFFLFRNRKNRDRYYSKLYLNS